RLRTLALAWPGAHGAGSFSARTAQCCGPRGRATRMRPRLEVAAMAEAKLVVPVDGAKIHIEGGKLVVPDHPIIPFIEGDGTGPDIWRASVRVLDAAVAKAYGGKRKIRWMEVYAGQKSFDNFGSWLPDETVKAFSDYLVGIKGPLTTPIGGGIRSLNVAL